MDVDGVVVDGGGKGVVVMRRIEQQRLCWRADVCEHTNS